MTTSIGGTSVPDPTGISFTTATVGAQYNTADGALNSDTIKEERVYQLTWGGITPAQMETIAGKAIVYTAAAWIFPDYAPSPGKSCIPVMNSFSSSHVGGKSGAVNCSVSIRTVT